MRIALATIIKGDKYDEWFLDKVFPQFKGLFGCFLVRDAREKGWSGNFAEAKNELVHWAEDLGCDWIFFMDADESMFVDDVKSMIAYIKAEVDDIIIQPRINFLDINHIEDQSTPDYQGRVFKLNVGYHFRDKVHETVFKGEESCNWYTKKSGYRAIDCPIFHYGLCKPKEEFDLKYWRKGEQYVSHLYLGNHPLKNYELFS